MQHLIGLPLAAGLALLTAGASAQTAPADDRLEEVKVVGQQIAGPQFDIKSTQTGFDLEAIEDLQPGSVFDILSEVPGVALTGGPRANGISINVRGFADNEDTLIIVDGAVKNFEKYRFGSVMPEPELLRRLTVSRGPASVLQGSGAVGGVIEMETRDAADFLDHGDRFGGFAKLGYADNNRELLTIGSLYGRPTDTTDALISFTKRDSDNLELSTGEELPHSAAGPEALLAKMEWSSSLAVLGLSYSATATQGLELFDSSAFNNGVNGQVHRETEDDTWASYLNLNPASPLMDAQFNLAYTDTRVDEQSVDAAGNRLPRGWDYRYDIWSGRAHNTATFAPGNHQTLTLQFGLQAWEEERTTRITDIEGGNSEQAELSQPSGKTLNWGSYLQAQWDFRGLSATVGYRWDHNNTEVLQPQTRDLMRENDLPTRIEQREGLLNYRLDYRFSALPVTLFHSYVEAARYPKLDEYYTQSHFSRCVSDSSDAEILVSQLQASDRDTRQAIREARANADDNLDSLIDSEIAQRDAQIAYNENLRARWIAEGRARVASGEWTQSYYETQRATTDALIDDTIQRIHLTADHNIDQYTARINNTLATNIASQEADHERRLAAAGIEDPDIDLYNLDYPTRTILPAPYESLEFCGALYQPERVENREWGISYASSALLTRTDSLRIKLVYYDTRVNHLLESINTNPANPASQPGREKIWGYELESTYIVGGWRFDLTYNKSRGEVSGYRVVDNPEGSNRIDDTRYAYLSEEKYDMPADRIALTTRWISPGLTWELGVTASYKYSRDAQEFVDPSSTATTVVRQPSITEYDLFTRWRPVENTRLRLTVNNVTNESYKTPGGISEDGSLVLGNYNVGRTVKLSATHYF